MEDREVIEAFLEGAGAAFGTSVHIEGGVLKLDGWWALAYRVSERTYILRDEEAPTESSAPADVAAGLTGNGLSAVGRDLPAIALLTYTNLDLGYAPWVLWSTDLATGESDLNSLATQESFLETRPAPGAATAEFARTDHVQGARRVAGDPSRVVLAVGVGDEWATPLQDGLVDCRLERRAFGEIQPADCGALLPTLVLVDATAPVGVAFVDELQVSRATSAPVVAITMNGEMRVGVDATVDAADPPASWVGHIRDLLG